jgi:hypothetical protein
MYMALLLPLLLLKDIIKPNLFLPEVILLYPVTVAINRTIEIGIFFSVLKSAFLVIKIFMDRKSVLPLLEMIIVKTAIASKAGIKLNSTIQEQSLHLKGNIKQLPAKAATLTKIHKTRLNISLHLLRQVVNPVTMIFITGNLIVPGRPIAPGAIYLIAGLI